MGQQAKPREQDGKRILRVTVTPSKADTDTPRVKPQPIPVPLPPLLPVTQGLGYRLGDEGLSRPSTPVSRSLSH